MKKIILALALVLGLASCAMAEKLQCKSAMGTAFTVEVPQGWITKQMQGGCTLLKQDGLLENVMRRAPQAAKAPAKEVPEEEAPLAEEIPADGGIPEEAGH